MAVSWYSPSAVLTPGGVAAGLSDLAGVISSAPERKARIEQQMAAEARANREAAIREIQLGGAAPINADPGLAGIASRSNEMYGQQRELGQLGLGLTREMNPLKVQGARQDLELQRRADERAGLSQALNAANLGIELPGYDNIGPLADYQRSVRGLEYEAKSLAPEQARAGLAQTQANTAYIEQGKGAMNLDARMKLEQFKQQGRRELADAMMGARTALMDMTQNRIDARTTRKALEEKIIELRSSVLAQEAMAKDDPEFMQILDAKKRGIAELESQLQRLPTAQAGMPKQQAGPGMVEGRTGTVNGQRVIVRGGQLVPYDGN